MEPSTVVLAWPLRLVGTGPSPDAAVLTCSALSLPVLDVRYLLATTCLLSCRQPLHMWPAHACEAGLGCTLRQAALRRGNLVCRASAKLSNITVQAVQGPCVLHQRGTLVIQGCCLQSRAQGRPSCRCLPALCCCIDAFVLQASELHAPCQCSSSGCASRHHDYVCCARLTGLEHLHTPIVTSASTRRAARSRLPPGAAAAPSLPAPGVLVVAETQIQASAVPAVAPGPPELGVGAACRTWGVPRLGSRAGLGMSATPGRQRDGQKQL